MEKNKELLTASSCKLRYLLSDFQSPIFSHPNLLQHCNKAEFCLNRWEAFTSPIVSQARCTCPAVRALPPSADPATSCPLPRPLAWAKSWSGAAVGPWKKLPSKDLWEVLSASCPSVWELHLIQPFALEPYRTSFSRVCAQPCTSHLSSDPLRHCRPVRPALNRWLSPLTISRSVLPFSSEMLGWQPLPGPSLSGRHPWLPAQRALQSSRFCCSLAIASCLTIERDKEETYRKLQGKARKIIIFGALVFGS